MGKEATCSCMYAGEEFQVKVLLESAELIVRGELKKQIPRALISEVQVASGHLHFLADGIATVLLLGETAALKWQAALLKPPPTLAHKLGITPSTTVQTFGSIDDGSLLDALQIASCASSDPGDLIVARVDEAAELGNIVKASASELTKRVPLWIIFKKGPGHLLTESSIRDLLRAKDLVDIKVASVSPKLTGLKFIHR